MSARVRGLAATLAAALLGTVLAGCAATEGLELDVVDVSLSADRAVQRSDASAADSASDRTDAADTYYLPAGSPGRIDVWFHVNQLIDSCSLTLGSKVAVRPTLGSGSTRYLVSTRTGALVEGQRVTGLVECWHRSGSGDSGQVVYFDEFTVVVSPDPPVGRLALSASSLSFGDQAEWSDSAPQVVTVTNTGSAPVGITSVGVEGAQAGWFSASGCAGQGIPAGGSCSVSVVATPRTLGSASATVSIVSDGSGSPNVFGVSVNGVLGSGTPVFQSASTRPGDEGIILYSASDTPSAVLTITNAGDGTARLHLSALRLTGTDASSFVLQTPGGVTDSCADMMASGFGLAPGATCRLYMRYLGTVSPTSDTFLEVEDNAAGSPHRITVFGFMLP